MWASGWIFMYSIRKYKEIIMLRDEFAMLQSFVGKWERFGFKPNVLANISFEPLNLCLSYLLISED